MVSVRTLKNEFFADYGDVSIGTILQMTPEDAEKAIAAGNVKRLWTTAELQQDFTVEGFSMGIVAVRRKSDGQRGSMNFDHSPRYYYDFVNA